MKNKEQKFKELHKEIGDVKADIERKTRHLLNELEEIQDRLRNNTSEKGVTQTPTLLQSFSREMLQQYKCHVKRVTFIVNREEIEHVDRRNSRNVPLIYCLRDYIQ